MVYCCLKISKNCLESKPFNTSRKLPSTSFAKLINTIIKAHGAYGKCSEIMIYECKHLLCSFPQSLLIPSELTTICNLQLSTVANQMFCFMYIYMTFVRINVMSCNYTFSRFRTIWMSMPTSTIVITKHNVYVPKCQRK